MKLIVISTTRCKVTGVFFKATEIIVSHYVIVKKKRIPIKREYGINVSVSFVLF